MKRSSTKQHIIHEALTLFSEKGYEAISVAQIAEAVGIKAPSLYKHFKSKREIFEAILIEMDARYQEQSKQLNMDGADPMKDLTLFASITEQNLFEMGKQLFLYFLHDDYVKRFRKMLTIEQFQHQELSLLYTKQYLDDPLAYEGMLFGLLISCGSLQPEDPDIMALQFYAPLYVLLTLCDRQPEREEQALHQLKLHIQQFQRIYKRKDTI